VDETCQGQSHRMGLDAIGGQGRSSSGKMGADRRGQYAELC
jgi:hypothetical protein